MKKILILCFVILLITPLTSFLYAANTRQDISALKKQAARGNIEAQIELGEAYYYGDGVLKDPSLAKFWIKKAYENGSQQAHQIWQNLELWKIPDSSETSKPIIKKRKLIYTERVTGMKFVWIPPGCFTMGCPKKSAKCKKNETPPHKICLTGFYIGRYEVTQAQYQTIMKTNPSRFYNDNNPVENVSWDDATKFTARLNKKSNINKYEFSLPTEAQWEYACQSLGKNKTHPWNADSKKNMANCGNCLTDQFTASTVPVGSFKPNSIGLFDMAGNVSEWCLDVYDKKAYRNHGNLNPVNNTKGSKYVIRGGSFADNLSNLRCTGRKGVIKFMKTDYTGFRLVRKEISLP
jgi:formylglycine-generating enzyme required for sulfatase activity